MSSCIEQCELMKMMVQIGGCRRGIEIGTFTGYSALCLAEALPDDGILICLDVDPGWEEVAHKYWK